MMPQPQKPQPQLNQQTTKELNLTVLQRMDAAVEDILATAGHVTIYEFDVNEQTWSRKDVEGALFVVKRREQPRFQFVVMNRRSQDNLVEDLLADFEFELRPPYLLYRNALQEVNGIWFYNPHECEEIAKLFTRILNAFSKAPPKAKLFSAPAAEFQELEAVPTAATVEGPLEPAAAPPIATMAEEPLERFFSVGPTPPPANGAQAGLATTLALPSAMGVPGDSHRRRGESGPPVWEREHGDCQGREVQPVGLHRGLVAAEGLH